MPSNDITHKGIVKDINDENISVSILAETACVSCKAQEICGVAEGKEKTIDVKTDGSSYKIGDTVVVAIKESMGFRALFLAYILPFVVLIIILISALQIIKSEGIAALVALGFVSIYYIVLYIYRDQIKKKFHFSIIDNLHGYGNRF